MAYGGSSQQVMDFRWQIARKIDRLDLGDFAAIPFFFRNAIIFGAVRAIDPEETRDFEKVPMKKDERTIDQLMESIDTRINNLLRYDTTAILMGKTQLEEVQEFQIKTMSAYYEIMEVTHQCKLTDLVRAKGEEI